MTKIRCNECMEWIDFKDCYIDLNHGMVIGTSIYAFCKECIAKSEESE